MRANRATAQARAGRLTKALQFQAVAQDVLVLASEDVDVGDAYVTLCIHAGIAAADVVCMARIGEYSRSESHHDAVQLLKRADVGLSKALETLLRMKTRAGYGHDPMTDAHMRRAERAMQRLVEAARSV